MQKRLGALGAALIGSFVVVACAAAFTGGGGHPQPSPTASPTHGSGPTPTPAPARPTASAGPGLDEYVSTLVPAKFQRRGVKAAVAVGSSPLDAALAGALATVMGVPWDIITVPAVGGSDPNDAIIAGLQSGQYDAGLSDISETASRDQDVDWATYIASAPDGPQGIAFPKSGSGTLAEATQDALIVLLADGTFQRIFSLGHPLHATPVTTASQVTNGAAGS